MSAYKQVFVLQVLSHGIYLCSRNLRQAQRRQQFFLGLSKSPIPREIEWHSPSNKNNYFYYIYMGYVSFIPKNSQSYLLPAYLSQHMRLLLHHGPIATAKSHGEFAESLLWKGM